MDAGWMRYGCPVLSPKLMFRSALLWVAPRLEVAVIIFSFFAFTFGRPDSFDQRFCLWSLSLPRWTETQFPVYLLSVGGWSFLLEPLEQWVLGLPPILHVDSIVCPRHWAHGSRLPLDLQKNNRVKPRFKKLKFKRESLAHPRHWAHSSRLLLDLLKPIGSNNHFSSSFLSKRMSSAPDIELIVPDFCWTG